MDYKTASIETGLQAIVALATELPFEPDRQKAREALVFVLCRTLQASLGCSLVFDAQRREFCTERVWYRGSWVATHLVYNAISRGPLAQVYREQRVHVTANKRPTPLVRDLGLVTSTPVGPALFAPIVTAGRLEGAMVVVRLPGEPTFTEKDCQLAEAIISVAALQWRASALDYEVKSLREQLMRAEAQLLQSAKLAATGKLAASIAHEINNPLQAVQSCIYLVSDSVPPEGPGRQYLNIAREELERVAKIVQRLADFYRPSREGQKPAQINALLESVLTLMSKPLQQGKIKLEKDLSPNLPEAIIVADQIKQVFVNLILNAIEAMPNGGELRISTRIASEPEGLFIEISFEDTGVGIASDALGRIYEPFYTTKAKGTGLGLSISQDIVQRHGGVIQVKSVPEQGSTFTVKLPIGAG